MIFSKIKEQNDAVGKNGGGCSGYGFCDFFRERVPSLYDFGKSDRRFSTEQEGKLLYATRTTRGHQFGGVPTTPKGRDLSLLVLILV